MRNKILAAALLTGMSSVALADHGADARFAPASWQSLAPTVTAHYWFGQEVVRVPDDRDQLAALRLVNGSGATYVYAMKLRFDDGHVDTIPVTQWLYEGQPRLTFKVARDRGLAQVTLDTFSWGSSTFQITGQRSVMQPPYGEPPPPPPPPASVVVPLATNLTFANTSGYINLPVGRDKGTFSKVQIKSLDSATYIGDLYVTFQSGAHQRIAVDRILTGGQVLDLDLRGDRSALAAIALVQDRNGGNGRSGCFDVSLIR
jgi:hypothetical protein